MVRFQFSLRALLALMLAICIALVATMPVVRAIKGVVRVFSGGQQDTYRPQAPPYFP